MIREHGQNENGRFGAKSSSQRPTTLREVLITAGRRPGARDRDGLKLFSKVFRWEPDQSDDPPIVCPTRELVAIRELELAQNRRRV